MLTQSRLDSFSDLADTCVSIEIREVGYDRVPNDPWASFRQCNLQTG